MDRKRELHRMIPAIDRFQASYTVNLATGCWEWDATINSSQGYAMIMVKGKRVLAHRFSYEYHVGPIPTGLQLDHLCRNRSCVNPSHLEAVSIKQNVLSSVGITPGVPYE